MHKKAKLQQKTPTGVPPLRLALTGTAVFACFSLLPLVRSNSRLAGSFWGATAGLLLFTLAVRHLAKRQSRTLSYEFLPRPVHYVQLMMHSSIYLYWGWYWREVYHYAPLIAAQIVYVYVFDMLLCWSRRDKWVLGFGPFPIVLSTNLFLWFRDDWFWLQFLLISTGVLCKEFITWNREGRRVHIFNPSAVALSIFSIGLLVTGNTHLTWGEEVAVTLGRPPHIYLEIFLVGLVVQSLFSVTLVTLFSAGTLYILNVAYTQSTGVYHFVDSNIPIATFLGLHLLVTDPATSPRNNLGKAIFGTLYGSLVFAAYAVLSWFGQPTFYDKLLCVPALNLTAQALDRASVAALSHLRWPNVGPLARLPSWSPRRLNFVHMAVWIALFSMMWTTGFVGARHPGSDPQFWLQACREGRRNACRTWIHTASIMCQYDSATACFQLGTELNEGRIVARDPYRAGKVLGRACDMGNPMGCLSLISLVQRDGPGPFEQACTRKDGESCFILASLYHAGQGVPKNETHAADLYRQACQDQWWRGCGRLAESYRRGQGVPLDLAKAIENFDKACTAGQAASCVTASEMYGAMNDRASAEDRLRQACEFGTRYAASKSAYFMADTSPQSAAAEAYCAAANR
ncbi:MAG: hypothetical protein QOJ99_68 [Bryobacterales bacterium]|nr:hypothetical protein [Bryobacterales bacterium]